MKALFGLGLAPEEVACYEKHAGRVDVPHRQAREAWLVCGRRSGKSLIAAFVAVFLACFRSYAEYVAPGEYVTIMVIAGDRRQARTVMSSRSRPCARATGWSETP